VRKIKSKIGRDSHPLRLMTTFWSLVAVFFLLLTLTLLGIRLHKTYLILIGLFFFLGLALMFFTLKAKVAGKLRKFLILTGTGSVGFFVSVILHNLIYGLFIYLFGSDFWQRVGLSDEPFFFFVAILVCPLVFLIGVLGTVVILIKRRTKS